MTTDREALEQVLTRFGITPANPDWRRSGVRQDPVTKQNSMMPLAAEQLKVIDNQVMLLASHGGVEGYGNFHVVFQFDDDGKFENVGVWE